MSESKLEQSVRPKPPTLWQENHGSFLLAFVGAIFLVGAGFLLFRRSQFVPPRFPDGTSIDTPAVPGTPVIDGTDTDGIRATIFVSGAVSDSGTIMVAIYDSQETFNQPPRAVMREPLKIKDGQAAWPILLEELPTKLAIAAFHDENGDGELNRNGIGIPLERYGFSNQARGLTGPAEFSDAVIDRPEAGNRVVIYIR